MKGEKGKGRLLVWGTVTKGKERRRE